jgi:hypothetical protein
MNHDALRSLRGKGKLKADAVARSARCSFQDQAPIGSTSARICADVAVNCDSSAQRSSGLRPISSFFPTQQHRFKWLFTLADRAECAAGAFQHQLTPVPLTLVSMLVTLDASSPRPPPAIGCVRCHMYRRFPLGYVLTS